MKAVILAAGKGTRMRPLTLHTPKPMINVLGKPLLHHIIDSLPGEITELILVVGYKQEQVRQYFGSEFEGKKVTYVEQKERLGTGHALSLCKDYLADDERFLFMVGDDLHSPKALKNLIQHKLGALAAEHLDPKRFGVFEVDENNQILSIEEKPEKPKSNLISPAVFVLNKKIFSYELKQNERLGEYFLTDQIAQFIKEDQFILEKTEFWHPIGYPHDIDKAEEILSKGEEPKPNNTLLVILAGGKGTRMPKDEQDKPKVMVEITGKPLLQHQIEIAQSQGFNNIRLSLGYMADYIIDWLKQSDCQVDYVVEDEPLGTGGAIKLAIKNEKRPFIAINGDDIADVNYRALIRHGTGGHSVVTGMEIADASAYGLLDFDKDKKVTNFKEKEPNSQGSVNIGHYYLHPEIFADMPESFSIERDLFPKLAQNGKIVLMEHKGNYWFGCGTPETLSATREYFAKSHD